MIGAAYQESAAALTSSRSNTWSNIGSRTRRHTVKIGGNVGAIPPHGEVAPFVWRWSFIAAKTREKASVPNVTT